MSEVESRDLREEMVEFEARDGFGLNLVHVTGRNAPTRGPVLLVHGAGVRANIFRPPNRRTLVDMLVDEGYDVWLENWRASTDLEPNQWTLDKVAVNDHPAAVEKVVEETGSDRVQAVIHCQGSTSFMISAVRGLVPQVKTVISNAVSLHTVLPRLSRIKLWALITLAGSHYPYMNPQWGLHAPHLRAKLTNLWVRMTHHECDNMVCKQASFTYGIGFPTLWEHSNLSDETHEWIKGEFEEVPRSFFRQMNRSVAQGYLAPVEGDPRVPPDFVHLPVETDARFVFMAGELNRCFLPESQRRTFEMFESRQPGRHGLHEVPGYAHLDMFIGKNADRDVFPTILEELDSEA